MQKDSIYSVLGCLVWVVLVLGVYGGCEWYESYTKGLKSQEIAEKKRNDSIRSAFIKDSLARDPVYQDSLKKAEEAYMKWKTVDDNRKTSGHRIVRYLNQKTLNQFISKYIVSSHFEPLECYDGGKKVNGYRAEALADICDVFLQARKEIDLSPRQAIIADQCEILMRAFARVGITALVQTVRFRPRPCRR